MIKYYVYGDIENNDWLTYLILQTRLLLMVSDFRWCIHSIFNKIKYHMCQSEE